MSPTSGIHGMAGANPMADPLEFVRNMWGAMKIPGMTMPSMSPDEINKQIADLKAVESWLQLNMNMLRSSIQALEIQSATLSTLQTMGQNFTQAVKPQEEPAKPSPFSSAPDFESPFSAFTKPAEKEQPDAVAGSNPSTNSSGADAASMAAQFVNPAAWWNVVQDQFTQAVGSAMTPAKKPAKKSAKSTTARKKSAPKSSSGNAAAGHEGEARSPARKKPSPRKTTS